MVIFANEYNVPVSFILAEKLYKLGYAVGTHRCITRYDSDFIYDGDPEHPESHKAGEIHIYDFWHRNNKEEKTLFECPFIEELVAWLLTVHHIYIYAVPTLECNYGMRWYCETMRLEQERITRTCSGNFPSRMEALMAAAENVIDELLKQKTENAPCSEHFF